MTTYVKVLVYSSLKGYVKGSGKGASSSSTSMAESTAAAVTAAAAAAVVEVISVSGSPLLLSSKTTMPPVTSCNKENEGLARWSVSHYFDSEAILNGK